MKKKSKMSKWVDHVKANDPSKYAKYVESQRRSHKKYKDRIRTLSAEDQAAIKAKLAAEATIRRNTDIDATRKYQRDYHRRWWALRKAKKDALKNV